MLATHRVPENKCPVCLSRLDGAMGISDNNYPNVGDITFCASCFTILRFITDLKVEVLTDGEIAALPDYVKEELSFGIATFMLLKAGR